MGCSNDVLFIVIVAASMSIFGYIFTKGADPGERINSFSLLERGLLNMSLQCRMSKTEVFRKSEELVTLSPSLYRVMVCLNDSHIPT